MDDDTTRKESTIMESRFTVLADAPALYKALAGVTAALGADALAPRLKHLIDLRVSQINGCAFCIGMHSKEALHGGDSADRLAALADWEGSDLFQPDERAAFAWAEALTRNRHDRLDDLHRDLQRHFDAATIAALTMAVATINAWNRVGIAQFRETAQRDAA